MSKIEDLLEKLCPKGIQYQILDEVAEIKRGSTITKSETSEGEIPVIAGGQKPAYYHNESNREGETIAVAGSGAYAGFVSYWNTPVFVSDAFTVRPMTNSLKTKFCFYFLKSLQTELHAMKSGGGVPHVYGKDVGKLRIPTPPVEIQEEIVRILDTFTDLEAELEAELEARKTQANFYKRFFLNLATFPTAHLGDVVEVLDNLRKPVSRDKREAGEYPYYGANGIQGYVKNYIFDGTYLLMGEDGSVINPDQSPVLTWVEGKVWVNNHAHVLREKSERASLRYIYYALQTRNVSQIVRGTPPKINQANMRGIEIPLPPLKEQIAIAKALDHFTKLEIQIATELDLRRKQYEYYRYKLLTFKELEAA